MEALEMDGLIEVRKFALLRHTIRDAVYEAMKYANSSSQYNSQAGKAFDALMQLIMPLHHEADEKKKMSQVKRLKRAVTGGPMKVQPMVYNKKRR